MEIYSLSEFEVLAKSQYDALVSYQLLVDGFFVQLKLTLLLLWQKITDSRINSGIDVFCVH